MVAIGNRLRRDDGVAHRVLELAGPMPGAKTWAVTQLTPEMAEEMAGADRVVFIDADIEGGKARIEPVEAGRWGTPLGHAMGPGEVVGLARSLFNFQGEALLCRVPGADFSEGEDLTAEAELNAVAAAEILRRVLRT